MYGNLFLASVFETGNYAPSKVGESIGFVELEINERMGGQKTKQSKANYCFCLKILHCRLYSHKNFVPTTVKGHLELQTRFLNSEFWSPVQNVWSWILLDHDSAWPPRVPRTLWLEFPQYLFIQLCLVLRSAAHSLCPTGRTRTPSYSSWGLACISQWGHAVFQENVLGQHEHKLKHIFLTLLFIWINASTGNQTLIAFYSLAFYLINMTC